MFVLSQMWIPNILSASGPEIKLDKEKNTTLLSGPKNSMVSGSCLVYILGFSVVGSLKLGKQNFK